MSSNKTEEQSPFKTATASDKRLKLLVYGDSGVGKTVLSLQFPSPVIIDLERGAEPYGDKYNFDIMKATSADDVSDAVIWLRNNDHEYRTLIIDPITVYWEAIQKKWSDIFLVRNKQSKGFKFEYYDFQPKDWMTIKAEMRELIRKITYLDMNVIVTARLKPLYEKGSMMKEIGETFDGEKSLRYLFDTVIKMYRTSEGKFMSLCEKDRTGHLPVAEFPTDYTKFEELFGKDNLERKAEKVEYATEEQTNQLKDFQTIFEISDKAMMKRLTHYGAESLEYLTTENAKIILEKFEIAYEERQSKNGQEPERKVANA